LLAAPGLATCCRLDRGYQPPPPLPALTTAADARVWWVRLGGGDIRTSGGGVEGRMWGTTTKGKESGRRKLQLLTVAGGCVCVWRGGGMCWAAGDCWVRG